MPPLTVPGLLAEGADFQGRGEQEQLAVERERLWQIGGNGTPVVPDPKGAQFWPQSYQLLHAALAVKSGQVPLAGPAIVRFELLGGLTAQPRYALLARGSSIIVYDARVRGIQQMWTGQAPITGVGIVGQSGGKLHLLVATSDSLLWRLDWNRGMDSPPAIGARSFPDAIAAVREGGEGSGSAVIAGAHGLYVFGGTGTPEMIASGDFTSAWPLVVRNGKVEAVAAATRKGEVVDFHRRLK
jgi:hypothetical protein